MKSMFVFGECVVRTKIEKFICMETCPKHVGTNEFKCKLHLSFWLYLLQSLSALPRKKKISRVWELEGGVGVVALWEVWCGRGVGRAVFCVVW